MVAATVSIADNASLDPTSAISFGAWFKAKFLAGWPSGPTIIGKAQGSGYFLDIDETFGDCAAGSLCAGVFVVGGYVFVSTPSFTFNVWHHAIITYDAPLYGCIWMVHK